MLRNITAGLLTGDNVLPEDEEVLIGLVQYALTTTAMKADSLHLMTLSTSENILRLAPGDFLIRVPHTPEDAEDDVDIDEELIFAVARFIASYVSRDKGGVHVQAANRIIADYNARTWEMLDQMKKVALNEGLPAQEEGSYAMADTTFTTGFTV